MLDKERELDMEKITGKKITGKSKHFREAKSWGPQEHEW